MLYKLFFSFSYCLIFFSLRAQPKNATPWEYLSNGKDLTGWKSLNGHAIGLEYHILDDARHPYAKLGSISNRMEASLYDLIPSIKEPRTRNKVGEWDRGMIVVYPDGREEHWLNEWKMLDYQHGTQQFLCLGSQE